VPGRGGGPRPAPPPPRSGGPTNPPRRWGGGGGGRPAPPGLRGTYNPPLEVLLSAVLAADWAAEAAEDGEADPARAPFTFS